MQERVCYDNLYNQSIRLVEPMSAIKPALVSLPTPVANDLSNARSKRYKAFFKHLTEAEKAEFKSQRCVVPISMGQRYHEGKRLEALLKLVDRSFASCTIVLVDLLHRHSLEIVHKDKPEHDRAKLAIHMGKEWMSKNAAYINQLTIPHNVTFWSDWIIQPAFQAYQDIMEALYIDDKEYKNACDSMANQFLSRRQNKYGNCISAHSAVLKYILEESAVICLFAKAGYDVEVYPCTTAVPISLEYISTKIEVTKKHRSPLMAIERT